MSMKSCPLFCILNLKQIDKTFGNFLATWIRIRPLTFIGIRIQLRTIKGIRVQMEYDTDPEFHTPSFCYLLD